MKLNHLKHTKTTKGRKFENEFYTKEEIMKLLNECNKGTSGLRNKALIIILYRCGLKISEVLSLSVSDYNSNKSTLKIGKNKFRFIGLDSQTKKIIDMWLLKRNKLKINQIENNHMFCGISKINFGKPIQGVYIRNLLKRLAKKAGIEKRFNPNSFRYNFGNDLISEGIGIQQIQMSLGHSSICSTSKHLHRLNPEETLNTLKNRNW